MKTKIFIALFVVIFIGGISAYYIITREVQVNRETVIASRGTITEEVSVTGKVQAAEEIKLAFERAGKINKLYVIDGDIVTVDQILVELDKTELLAKLAEAEANRDTAQAKLDELRRGTRPEKIEIQKTIIFSKERSLEDAQHNLINVIRDAYTKSDDAVRDKIDTIYNNPQSEDPTITVTALNANLKKDLQNNRFEIGKLLIDWNISSSVIKLNVNLETEKVIAEQNLITINKFLDDFAILASGFIVNANITQATIDAYRADISTARTNLAIAITNFATAVEKLRTAETNLTIEKQELLLLEAGTTPEEIATQIATVKQTSANLQSIYTELTKATLRSPINGIITNQNAKIGELVTANSPIISVFSEQSLEIEANIPEADIIKVKVGDIAEVTLDAYGSSRIFSVRVRAIDPTETVIEGVTTYKTMFVFLNQEELVKSGMTANLDIITARRDNSIILPSRAVIQKNGEQIVRIVSGDTIREVPVITGIRSLSGMIEIIQGIQEGDEVVTFIEE